MDPNSDVVLEKKLHLLKASKSKSTVNALNKQLTIYQNWCSSYNVEAFPAKPEVYEAYFIHLLDKGWKRSSIDQAKWALDTWHKNKNLPNLLNNEEFKTFFKGLHRLIGSRQTQKKELTIEHIKQMSFKGNLVGLRDKALLLTGFSGGFRRSELISLNVEDVAISNLGARINIKKSKTNQAGFLEEVDIPWALDKNYCPVTLICDWLKKADIKTGPIFRSFYRGEKIRSKPLSDHQVAVITKKYMASIGLDPKLYSGHSLRAGCATFLLQNNVPLNIVAKQLRHKRVDTTLKYDRGSVYKAIKGLY